MLLSVALAISYPRKIVWLQEIPTPLNLSIAETSAVHWERNRI